MALVGADGTLLFANPAMRAILPPKPVGRHLLGPAAAVPSLPPAGRGDAAHAASRPRRARFAWSRKKPPGAPSGDASEAEHLVLTHAVHGPERAFVGVMLVARDLEYLGQVQSSVNCVAPARRHRPADRRRRARGEEPAERDDDSPRAAPPEAGRRASRRAREAWAGRRGERPAGEPAAADVPGALEHAGVIAGEIRRLDEVLQGFIKFTRPEELTLRPIRVADLVGEVVTTIGPQTEQGGVTIRTEGLEQAPDINGDHGPAAPGAAQPRAQRAARRCRRAARSASSRGPRAAGASRSASRTRASASSPSTSRRSSTSTSRRREQGSGMGLAMVYRTVQLHGGEIEVRSVEGHGTTFRCCCPGCRCVLRWHGPTFRSHNVRVRADDNR